jgi:large subunit ribosomal protein L29
MAKNDTLADLGDAELFERLAETKEELFNLRFQRVTGQLDNYARMKQVKRDVARVMTELRSREITAAESLDRETPAAAHEETDNG